MSADHDWFELEFNGVKRKNKYGYESDDGAWKAEFSVRMAQEGGEAQYVHLELTHSEFAKVFGGVLAAQAALEALNND